MSSGDRLDRLERRRPDSGGSSSVVTGPRFVTWATSVTSGQHKPLGSLTIPAGASKLTITGAWQLTDEAETLTGAGVDLSVDLASAARGGLGVPFGDGHVQFLQGVAVVVLTRAQTTPVGVWAETEGGGPIPVVRGAVIVEPL